jgi:hypothetical protein
VNNFLDLVERAALEGWCTKPGCRTCSAHEVRERLYELAGDDGSELVRALAEADLHRLCGLAVWSNCVRMAFDFLTDPAQGDQVLTAWLPQLAQHIPLADLVLFYRVRTGILFAPMSISVRDRWVAACVDLAIASRDASLLESLVRTLGTETKQYPQLQLVLSEVRRHSPRLERALAREGPA